MRLRKIDKGSKSLWFWIIITSHGSRKIYIIALFQSRERKALGKRVRYDNEKLDKMAKIRYNNENKNG